MNQTAARPEAPIGLLGRSRAETVKRKCERDREDVRGKRDCN
jgi:hypothetical protein